jgi:membrane-associated PAP2 superfamily phosphatase
MNTPLLSKKNWQMQFCFAFVFFLVICAVQSWTDWDFAFQRLWYNQTTKTWWLTAEEFLATRWLWYGGAKKAISFFAGFCAFVFILSFFMQKVKIWRKCCVLLLLSLLFVPLLVGLGKKITNVYCPVQIAEFNGTYEQHRIFEILEGERALEPRGGCFPGGHCSGGYALMMLFFALPYPRYRYLGLMIGLSVGSLMGGYQIVRGDHFLSDTLATMSWAWMINLILVYVIEKYKHKLKLEDSPALMDFSL